jgi:hypothetical protein
VNKNQTDITISANKIAVTIAIMIEVIRLELLHSQLKAKREEMNDLTTGMSI